MGHGHDHAGGGQSHSHAARTANRSRLGVVLALAAAYMVAEAVGGWLANSLALLADAGHMLSDVAALALSMFAMWIARRPPTARRTYGHHRTEILAALVNAATLAAISLLIFVEAYQRIRQPPDVQGGLVMGIAAGGLLVNLIGLWILNAGRNESLNVRGAWLHVLTDALGSVGAILGGAAVWAFGWPWADPAVSVVIGLLVIFSSWNLLKETVSILMEGAPRSIDADAVREEMASLPGVTKVHDVHVWSITSGMVVLSGHVQTAGERDLRACGTLLTELRTRLHDRFGIDHVTIQVEPAGFDEPEGHT